MQTIKINNYKNLEDIELKELSRVNLIVGNNNVGKSTLLEAIMIFASGGNINTLQEILEIRGERYSGSNVQDKLALQIESFASLFTGRDFEEFVAKGITISSMAQDIEKTLRINLVRFLENVENEIDQSIRRKILSHDDPMIYDPEVKHGVLVEHRSGDSVKPSLYPFGSAIRPNRGKQQEAQIEFVTTTQISRNENAALFDKIALTELEPEIIKALNIIEPNIEDINFLNDDYTRYSNFNPAQRIPYIVFKGSAKKVRLSSMGDGINRVLTIILALLNSKDGYLLVDEFDSGLHHSVQNKLWEITYNLSEKLNVQVFATTHSNDCIKSFVEADTNNAGKLIRLENIEGKISAVPFNDKERLKFAVDQNIEIR